MKSQNHNHLSSSGPARLYPLAKRAFDVVLAAFGLLLLWPVGLLIAVGIKLSDGGPVFYQQMRMGQWGRPFGIRKFRSMVVQADKNGLAVTKEEDPRITRLGRVLRKSKLDELPQLWNVLVGDMSFVGPRPEVPRYVERYTPEQREILQSKPGITDMATLLFRNEEALLRGAHDVEQFYLKFCLPRKIDLNREYAQRASLAQDFWIILQTLCPYWLGVTVLYTLILSASLFLAYLLKLDFALHGPDAREWLRVAPATVLPQVLLLVWRGQARGLLSYFSWRELTQTATALGIALGIQGALRWLPGGPFTPSPGLLLIHFFVSFVLLASTRALLRNLREHSHRTGPGSQARVRRVAIIGTGPWAAQLALDLSRTESSGRTVVAFFADDPHAWNQRPHDIPVVGMPECLLNAEWQGQLDEVIIALPEGEAPRARQIAEFLSGGRLSVSVATPGPILQPGFISE